MSSLYYGQRAYEGFAKAFASRIGVSVNVSGSTTSPHVDASGTIHLPGLNGYQTKEEFEDTCATVIHEIAHVYFGSHALFESFKAIKPRLWMECLNAVLDIADEAAMGASQTAAGNPRAEQLMFQSNARAGNTAPNLKPNPHKGKPNPAPAHWRILATGIIRSRCYKTNRTGYGRWLVKEFPALDIKRAFEIMMSCRGSRAGIRYSEGFLINRADELYTILETIAPADSEPQTPMPGGAGAGQPGTASPFQGTEATEADGEQEAGQTTPMGGNGVGGGGEDPSAWQADQGCFDTMLPIVKRIASRFATDGEAINNEGGYSAGMGVKDAYRLATDGQCMGRWTMDEHADGMAVAVLLDISGSMDDIITQVQGVAEAFAVGMKECANVKRWSFGEDVHEVDSFCRVRTEGDTMTGRAIKAAREWLSTQSAGQRLIVCLTDGQPNFRSQTPVQVALAISEGVKVIAVALGDCEQAISKSMPMATIVSAQDSNRLAIALEGITLQM